MSQHKLEMLCEREPEPMKAHQLNAGDYAVICDEDGSVDGYRGGEVVMRAYEDILVSVADPRSTWNLRVTNGPYVKRLQPGTKFAITVQ
ncbi:MAG: hypothetical protein ACXAEN_25900 [Candidatus Thorarchaeota archaeon]|jgi:hypothetical protein